MRRRTKGKTEEVFPDQPPDPGVARQQRAARQRDLERYLKNEILPRVNAALSSEDSVRYDRIGARRLSVSGFRQCVTVTESAGMGDWIEPLLKMLRSGPYRGYSVVAEGLWHSSSRGPNRHRTKLNEKDIQGSLLKLRRSYRSVCACIRITP